MKKLVALALALIASPFPSTSEAATPQLGTPEGELFCARTMRIFASGAQLATGEDPIAAVKAYGIFLGRLSLIAPEATTRSYLDEPPLKLSPSDEQAALQACLTKAVEIDEKHRVK